MLFPPTLLIACLLLIAALSVTGGHSLSTVSTSSPDFSMTANPTTINVSYETSNSSTITFTSLSGFSGTVNISSKLIPTPSFCIGVGVTSSVNVPSNSSVNGVVKVSGCGSGQTPEQGSFSINVTGTAGSLSHTTTVKIQLAPPPPYFIISGSAMLGYAEYVEAGRTVAFPLSVWGTFQGTITLTSGIDSVVSNGPIISFSPAQVTLPPAQTIDLIVSTSLATPPGSYQVSVTARSGNLSDSGFMALIVSPPGDVNNDGVVNVRDLVTIALAYNATPSSPNWNSAADVNGDGKVDITDLALAASYFQKTY